MKTNTQMIITHGNFQVTRFCCTSGLCVDCHSRGGLIGLARRQKVVQIDRLSKKTAIEIAANFSSYEGAAELMPTNEGKAK